MTVLLIDDDVYFRETLKVQFEALGFNVLEACNGLEGLHLQNQNEFAFIVTDINMPLLDGIEFLKIARQRAPHMPIFLVTSAKSYSEQEVIAMGASGYFEKFDLNALQIVNFNKNIRI